MSFVYILQSQKSGQFYIGSTGDLERRLTEHNRGQTKSTRTLRPWICAFSYETTPAEAKLIELRLKRLRSRQILEKIIAENKINFTRE